jgi:ferrous-iron efflux pump FieF
MPLIQAHRISDEVEASLIKAYPHAEVLIHQDPVSQYLDHDQDHEQNSGKS